MRLSKFPGALRHRTFVHGVAIFNTHHDDSTEHEWLGKLEKLTFHQGPPTVINLTEPQYISHVEDFIQKLPPDTLVVLPGGGALHMKWRMSNALKNLTLTHIDATRIWHEGCDPIAIVGEILPERHIWTNITDILVLDDAVSSGTTMRALHRKNAHRFPKTRWHAAALIAQNRAKLPQGPEGFESACIGLFIEGPEDKFVPMNSLRTLISDHTHATEYAKKHCTNPKRMLKILKNLHRDFHGPF